MGSGQRRRLPQNCLSPRQWLGQVRATGAVSEGCLEPGQISMGPGLGVLPSGRSMALYMSSRVFHGVHLTPGVYEVPQRALELY